MTSSAKHIPVLLKEAVAALSPRKGGIYIDATFGRGGYSKAILCTEGTIVVGIDRDREAIAAGQKLAAKHESHFTLLEGTFGDMENLLKEHGITSVDGIALDIGVSSPQIDSAERGFSFQADGPLDMRMGQTGPTAADLVNSMDEKDLADIIYHFGEERFSRRVARTIVAARAEKRIERTSELATLVRRSVPRSNDGIDPATRTFQALRIAVNDELGELSRGLRAAELLLKPTGRLAVVTFHSLEDRCVKEFLRDRSATSQGSSRHAPANDDHPTPSFTLINKKPITASPEELIENPRARSAKLRIAERTTAAPHKDKVA